MVGVGVGGWVVVGGKEKKGGVMELGKRDGAAKELGKKDGAARESGKREETSQ